MYKAAKRSKRLATLKKWWFLGLLLFLVGVLVALEFTNTTYLFHRRKAVSGLVPSTSPQSSTKSSDKSTTPSNNSSTSQNSSSQSTKNQGSTSGTELTAPFGTFVSNHRPNLDGSPAPSQEQSVCQTTPGASCYIKFTSGNIVKALPAQTVDQNGQVIWNWDVNQAGFTEGSWKITAIATLNGTTKTTDDSLALEIGP